MTARALRQSWTAAARRAGIDPDFYARNRRRGRRWCSWCHAFHPARSFSGTSSMCRKGFRQYERERKETPRPDPATPWAVYVAEPAERCDRFHSGALCEASARAIVHGLNAAAMRDWRPGQPQPALYYAVAGSEEPS